MNSNLMSFLKAILLGLVFLSSAAFAQDWRVKVKADSQLLPTVQMGERFVERDARKQVVYLNAEQREQYRVVVVAGIVYNSQGQPLADSKDGNSSYPDRINYVMDAHGNLYIFNEFLHKEIRHSSLFAGKPIAGGGEIAIHSGRITHIDSESGHYSTSSLMGNVLKELQADGVNTKGLGN